MGIETDRFVDNLPQEVLCPICCLVLKEPVCTPCDHYVCSSCWQSWRKGPSKELCPYCCKEIPLKVKPLRSQTIWKLVLNFNVHCPFHRDGCTVIYKLGLEDAHMEKCPYNKDNGCEKDYMDEEIKRNTLNQCTDCLNTIENAKEHDCLSVLLQRVQIQNIQITNLEYENDKLSLRLTTKENAIMDQLLDAENRFNEETLRYEKQIRELSTQIAAVEGKLRKRNGEIDEIDLKVTLERQNGSLGLNIVGGYQEGKDSSGIFISRIAENGAASKPGKLQLNDRVLEVNGCDLRRASHDEAVQAFKNSHGPVVMLIRRQVMIDKRTWSTATQTDQEFTEIHEVQDQSETNSVVSSSDMNQSKSCELTDSAMMSCSEAEESLVSVSENSKAGGPGKGDLYDSAYDTLLTQKSSRSHRLYSLDESVSSAVDPLNENEDVSSESSEDVRTLTPSTVINGYGSTSSNPRLTSPPVMRNATTRSSSLSTDDSLSPVHEVKLRRNSNGESLSPRKVIRRSTYYLVDESVNESLPSSLRSLTERSKAPEEDNCTVTSGSNELDVEYEYEYEEVSLRKIGHTFGIHLCYGGELDDPGVYIGKFESGSVAEINGRVIVGDQLIQINNSRVGSVEEACKMLQAHDDVTILVARPVIEANVNRHNGSQKEDEHLLKNIKETEKEIDSTSDTTNLESEGNSAMDRTESSSNEKTCVADSQSEPTSPVSKKSDKMEDPVLGGQCLESVTDCNKNLKMNTKLEKKNDLREDVKLTLKDYVLSRLRGHDKSKTKENDSDNSSQYEHCKNGTLERKSKKDLASETPRSGRKDYRKDSLSRREKRDNSSSNSPARISDCNISLIHEGSLGRPVRSAMKKESSKHKSPKHVRVDTKTDWSLTEKRVWEEFKIIQNMEAEEGKGQSGVEAEWKVRRSKDGKHIYIRKQSNKPNKSRFLKERADRLSAERTGITTDDDANTIYLGKFWNKEERKRQLMRHRLKREKLLERQIAKSSMPPNPMDTAMADIVQKNMTAPGHIFDDFLTVEEILSQRNKDGTLQGPIHVTTV